MRQSQDQLAPSTGPGEKAVRSAAALWYPTSRRRLLLGGGAAVAGGLLAACSPLGGRQTAQLGALSGARAPVGVDFHVKFNPLQLSTHQTMLVDAFQQAYPHLRLVIVPGEHSIGELATLLASGTPPDVTFNGDQPFYLAKLIQDITPLVQRDRYNVGNFTKETFDTSCTWRGRIISLPIQYGGTWPVMPYNKDLLGRAGVPEPPARWGDARWNAEAWLRALQRTTRLHASGNAASYGINLVTNMLIAQYWTGWWKGAWLSDDLKTITCDSPQMIEGFEYLVGLVTRHRVMATGPQLQQAFGTADGEKAFISGKLAMYFTPGAQAVIPIGQAVREHGLPLAYAPLPTFKTFGAAHKFNSNGLVVGTQHPAEGWTLMKWLADTPNWSVSRGNPPARVGFFETWTKNLYGGLETQMRLEVYRDSLRYTVRLDPIALIQPYAQMRDEIITPAFNRLFAGEASVATTLGQLKAPLQALVPKNLS